MTRGIEPAVLLRAEALTKEFPHSGSSVSTEGGRIQLRARVKAVDGFSLELAAREAVGVVGESGSGKTTVARCLLHLIRPTSGEIRFGGQSITALRGEALKAFRRDAQIVFQDPFASLDPRFNVQRTLAEPLIVHRICERREIPDRAAELLAQVGLKPEFRSRYRHELSGGEAQRVAVARALATRPRFLVLDEPTSALDASARLKVISLLRELRHELGMTYLVISHDLSIVRYLCDRVLVMYLGQVVEDGPAEEIFARPQHPYTEALLSATPVIRGTERVSRIRLRPTVDASPPEHGCPLTPRCPYATPECAVTPQTLTPIGDSHSIACHRVSAGEITIEPLLQIRKAQKEA